MFAFGLRATILLQLDLYEYPKGGIRMWKRATLLTTTAAILFSPNVLEAKSIMLPENEESIIEGYDTDYDFYFEPLILLEEEYDGENLIRTFQYADSGRKTLRFIELPSSITEQISTDDEKAVSKVTALLAQYYLQEDIDNLPSLNELLLAYTPDRPYNKLSVSKEYAHTFAENLNYVLGIIDGDKEVDSIKIPESEAEMLTNTKYDTNTHPYKTKDRLLEETAALYEDLRIKWYEKSSTYFALGAGTLLASLLAFIYKRDIKTQK